MNFKYLLVLIVLCLIQDIHSTEPATIVGKVENSDGDPLESVVITRLELPDSTFNSITVSNIDGIYELTSDSVPEHSMLLFTRNGYAKKYVNITRDTINIVLNENINQLDEFTITSKRSSFMAAPGCLAFDPSSLYGAMKHASELLRNIPMLNTNEDGINIFSKTGNADILINWTPITMPYEVFVEMLKKLPPKAIKAVVIEFSPSAISGGNVYERGRVCFLIDEIIVGTLSGATSRITIENGRPSSRSQIWSSWQNDLWQITGTINYQQTATKNRNSTEYIYPYDGITTKTSLRDKIDMHTLSGKINGKYTFGYLKNNYITIGASISGSKSWKESISSIDSKSTDGYETHAESNQTNTFPFSKPWYSVAAAYFHYNQAKDYYIYAFAGATVSPSARERMRISYSGKLIESDMLPDGYSQSSGHGSSGESAGITMEKNWRSIGLGLEGNYTIGYGKTNFNLTKESVDLEKFSYSEFRNDLSLSLNWRKSIFSFRAGVRMEQYHRKGIEELGGEVNSADFLNFCPDVGVSSSIKGGLHTVGIDYRANVVKPMFEQLNPMKVWISETMYRQGDPYMKPFLNHNISVRYGLFGIIHTSASYRYSPKNRNEIILPSPNEPGVTVLKSTLLGQSHSVDIRINFEKWFFDKTFKVNGSANYIWSKSYSGDTRILDDVASSFFNIEGGILWKLSKRYDYQLWAGAYYFTPSKSPGLTSPSKAGINLTLARGFNCGLDLQLVYSQLLTKNNLRYHSNAYEYTTNFIDARKPSFTFIIEYVFGNNKVQKTNMFVGSQLDGILR